MHVRLHRAICLRLYDCGDRAAVPSLLNGLVTSLHHLQSSVLRRLKLLSSDHELLSKPESNDYTEAKAEVGWRGEFD